MQFYNHYANVLSPLWRRYQTILFGCFTLFAPSAIAQNLYCDSATDCLFLLDQPEAILGDTVRYANDVFSIDEWDNQPLGCALPQCEDLYLEVYYPDLPDGEQRPLVVLIHGGGFVTGSRAAFRTMAQSLARKGYVAATISYRLCKRNNCLLYNVWDDYLPPFPVICNFSFMNDLAQAAYVATLDAHNAIRFLQQNAAQYHIDPDYVLVGGHSAGGWTAQHVAYLDQAEANTIGGGNNFEGIWGPLNPVSGIRGVFNFSGALLDTTYIQAEENIPTFFVTGTCDPVICYDYDAPYHCNAAYPAVHGGANIALRMHHLGLPYYLFTAQNLGHDLGPMESIWMPELLLFAKNTMLCDAFVQKHSIVNATTVSDECAILGNSSLLQEVHPPRPPISLPSTPLWGAISCNTTETVQPPSTSHTEVMLFPNPTPTGQVQILPTTARVLSVLNVHGQVVPFQQQNNFLSWEASEGLYFIHLSIPNQKQAVKKVIIH